MYLYEVVTRNEQPATLTQEELESRKVLNISLTSFCRRMSLYRSYFVLLGFFFLFFLKAAIFFHSSLYEKISLICKMYACLHFLMHKHTM